MQWAVAEAVNRALGAVEWSTVRGKSTSVAVATLTEGYGGRSPEDRYLEEAVRQRLRAAGAQLDGSEETELEVRVLGRTVGANRTRRDFILLYYAELVEGIADLEVQFLARGIRQRVLHTEVRAARVTRRRTYLFYIFGPLVKEWSE